MYIVEGTIGAGKSTFLTILQQAFPSITIAYEPLNSWNSEDHASSLLAQFYASPSRWSYTMETMTMLTRVQHYLTESAYNYPYHVMERSIYSGHYCFAQNGYEQGNFSSVEWHIYLQWFNFLIPQKCPVPQGFIYLRVSPEIAYERIKKRSRSAETTISLQYLEQLHRKHEQFLIDKVDVIKPLIPIPVLILDCNKEFETEKEEFEKHKEQIKLFMKLTT